MATQNRAAGKMEFTLDIQSTYPEVLFDLIDRNPNQPRQDFDGAADTTDLTKSVRSSTLIQVVTLRHHPTIPGRYMIVAGERRFRAMSAAGMTKHTFKLITGPGVEKSYILSAIENLQRVNLNPIEEALTYQRMHDDEHLSWEQIHELLGRDVPYMVNKIKLLTFPQEIQDRVRRGDLPQATALHLSQWQSEEGDYLRMAYALIEGRDPAEVHFRKDTARSQIQVQARLPKNSEDYARRIVKLSGRVQSMPAVLEAFLRLPPEERKQAFEAIHPSVRGKLRVRFIALYRAIQAMSELMNAFEEGELDGETSVPASVTPPPSPPPAPAPAPKPVAVPTLVPAAVRAEVPKPAVASAPATRNGISLLSPPPAPAPVQSATPRPQVAAPAGGNGHGTVDLETQSWDLSTRVIAALFYSGGHRKVNLSRSELVETMHDFLPQEADIDTVVTNALHAARGKWRMPPKGGQTEMHFTRLVAQFRRDYGDPKDIEDSFGIARSEDRSGDPVL